MKIIEKKPGSKWLAYDLWEKLQISRNVPIQLKYHATKVKNNGERKVHKLGILGWICKKSYRPKGDILCLFFHTRAKLIYDLQNLLNQFLLFPAFEFKLHLIWQHEADKLDPNVQ